MKRVKNLRTSECINLRTVEPKIKGRHFKTIFHKKNKKWRNTYTIKSGQWMTSDAP